MEYKEKIPVYLYCLNISLIPMLKGSYLPGVNLNKNVEQAQISILFSSSSK